MAQLDKWIGNKVVQNLAVWGFLLLVLSMVVTGEQYLETGISIVLFLLLPTYLNNLFILPLLSKKNKSLGLGLFLLNALCFSILAVWVLSDFFKEFRWQMLFNLFGAMVLALIFASALKIARDSILRRQKEKDAELKLLKAQLNPHFLFNTLNNLYGLAVAKSDHLPGLMLRLSDLLRYSLYDTKESFVELEKEVKYLENYISLERIRLEAQTDIQIEVSGEMAGLRIAPMLLIVFVENAFKHLGAGTADKSQVHISLHTTGNQLHFTCTNTTDMDGSIAPKLEAGKSGIGLENAEKRLALIYPLQHELSIENRSGEFAVALNLDCA